MFQGEKIACAKGLWSERTWHFGGTTEALTWLKQVSEGAVIKGKIIKGAHAGHIRSFCSLFIFTYLFMAALGLHCCMWVFSSCAEQGLFFIAGNRLLVVVASLVMEHRL